MTLTKKVTLGEVIGREYKSEVNALASEMAGGAKSGSKEAFGNYKKALKSFTDNLPDEAKAAAEVERKRWEKEGKPEEVKIRSVIKGRFPQHGKLIVEPPLVTSRKPGRRCFVRRLRCSSANLGSGVLFGNFIQATLEESSTHGGL